MLQNDTLWREIMETVTEADSMVASVTKPALESPMKFLSQAGQAVAIHIMRNNCQFDVTKRGLEIYNPRKAKIIQ